VPTAAHIHAGEAISNANNTASTREERDEKSIFPPVRQPWRSRLEQQKSFGNLYFNLMAMAWRRTRTSLTAASTTAGDSAKLKEHVGHTVDLNGKMSGAENPASPSASEPTIKVDSVTHVSANCEKPGDSAAEPKGAEQPPKNK
jgi:hypothetical protein